MLFRAFPLRAFLENHGFFGTCSIFIMESGNEYLPDLNNEKTGEQIVFELKVKRSNETFINKMEDVIKWLTSPSENRVYPKSASTN